MQNANQTLTAFHCSPWGVQRQHLPRPSSHYIVSVHCLGTISKLIKTQYMQGKRIGVISSIASNPNNDEEVNAKFAQAVADLQSAGELHDQRRCMFQSLSTHFLSTMCLCVPSVMHCRAPLEPAY